MFKRKVVLLSTLYIGAALGVPFLLVLLISQSYPVWNGSFSSSQGWQLKTERLTFEPAGQMLLVSNAVFLVYKGQIALINNYFPERLPSQVTQMTEGQTFSNSASTRYYVSNQQKTPVELIMVEVFPPGRANQTEPTPGSNMNRGYSSQNLDQRFMNTAPNRQELEKILFISRINLLKRS